MPPSEAEIEAAASALYEALSNSVFRWQDQSPTFQQDWRENATAALTAAEAVRGNREQALIEASRGLLYALSLGPLEVATIYGPDADDPVIAAAEIVRQALAAHDTASEKKSNG